MKSLKLSFALIVAVLAIGVTIASKASELNNRVTTSCFRLVTVTDGLGSDVILNGTSNEPSCEQAGIDVAAHPYLKQAALGFNQSQCPPDFELFCCVRIVETTDPLAPVIEQDLGDGPNKKYEIEAVICKP